MRTSIRRILLLLVVFFLVSFAVILVNQTLQLSEFAARFHPRAGEAVFWALVFLYAGLVGLPLYLFFRLPKPLVPPADEDSQAFEDHVVSLSARLARNPLVSGEDLSNREGIEAALETLDGQALEGIKAAGRRAFLTTAISQNGALDSLFVLGIQSKLIWDVAHMYEQRPTLRDMTYLYTNVLGTAFIAAELDHADLSAQIQPVLSTVMGSAVSAMPGFGVASHVFTNSVLTGTANAFLTLRVGIIAQEYSRGWVKPKRKELRRAAVTRAAGLLGAIAVAGAGTVSSAIAKASGRTMAGAVTGVGRTVKKAGSSVFDFLPFGRGEDEDREGTGGEAPKDPGEQEGGGREADSDGE